MNPSTRAAHTLIDALIFHGVRHVVISPGSRSAPLAYALAEYADAGKVQVHVRVDERVAAFTALGLSQYGPAAVVTTSGTAAANLHPALLEAVHSHRGLVAITADRPHELRGVGASQTTHQVGMFGPNIAGVDLPAGSGAAQIANQCARYLSRAKGINGPVQPVHINIGFADPLTPGGRAPIADWHHPRLHPGATQGQPVAVNVARRTVVVAGDGAGSAAAQFATEAGVPLLAEPTSGARHGTTAIGPYQHVLKDLGDEVEQVLVWGRPTLSRPVTQLLSTTQNVTVVADHPHWVDVAGNADQIITQPKPQGSSDPTWLSKWRRAGQEQNKPPHLAGKVLAHGLQRGQGQVMLGSSMTIRYADIFAPTGSEFITAGVYANRGLAGIDGTIATATGIGLESGPIRVILGDLSFAHDVGALAIGPQEQAVDIQIVVLNDGGGAIFKHLEHGYKEHEYAFDRFFATPVSINVEEISRAYGYRYSEIHDPTQIDELLRPEIEGRSIVEVRLPQLTGNF